MNKLKLPITVKIVIFLLSVLMLFSICNSVFKDSAMFYNMAISYRFELNQKNEDQITTFDNNYLAFKDKFNIADINKEAFITVTEIIMTSRKDGMNVAWKWMQENQQIPYDEFVSFYKELSSFTQSRFAENNSIERQKQEIVKRQNLLITSFPGIVYNHFFKIEPLVYKKGFVSEETRKLFNQ